MPFAAPPPIFSVKTTLLSRSSPGPQQYQNLPEAEHAQYSAFYVLDLEHRLEHRQKPLAFCLLFMGGGGVLPSAQGTWASPGDSQFQDQLGSESAAAPPGIMWGDSEPHVALLCFLFTS